MGERIWGDEEVVELRPYVVVPMCPVPAGKMPRGALVVVKLAVECGMKVWSTYAVALVPGVLRKVAGQMERVTVTLESVVVRFAAATARGYAIFHDGSFQYAVTREAGQWSVTRGMRDSKAGVAGIGTWMKQHVLR